MDFSEHNILRKATSSRNDLLADFQSKIHGQVLDVIRRDNMVRQEAIRINPERELNILCDLFEEVLVEDERRKSRS